MIVFFIFPHPDDETIFAGGTIARHVARGDKVIWICASYGERGGISEKRSPRLFYFIYLLLGYLPFLVFLQRIVIWWLSVFRKLNQEVIEIRKNEAEQVARIYGISKLHFLEIEDMKFGKNTVKLESTIEKYTKLYEPQLAYTFHPNGIADHPDHRYLAKSVVKVVESFPADKRPKVIGATIPKRLARKFHLPFLGIPRSEISQEVELDESELNQKQKAINAYKSQKYLWDIFLKKHPWLFKREYFIELL